MQLLFTGIPNVVLEAICQTLIHSLWQGLIAGLLAALIISFTKRSGAVVRYNLLLSVLLLFVLATGITTAIQFRYIGRTNAAFVTQPTANLYSQVNVDRGEKVLSRDFMAQNFLERLDAWCNEHAQIIVSIWFFLFLIKSGQLIAGFGHIQRVRHRNNYEVSPYWNQRLRELAQKTGIKGTFTFLESELIKIPAVIGHLKPLLLVPAGLLSNLPAEQVEAILLHELAHIHRRDFIANLLQSVIETFFFFNPAIVWISSLIREEREACCDDMVIAHIPQKTSYLQALVSFQEMRSYPNAGAIALTGNKHYLLNRVKRLLTRENKKLNIMEKTLLTLSIVGISAFGFITKETKTDHLTVAAFKNETAKPATVQSRMFVPASPLKKPATKQKKPTPLLLPKQIIDTVPKTIQQLKGENKFRSVTSNSKSDGTTTESQVEATDNQGTLYTIKRVNGEITSFSVNGTVIPKDKYDEYSVLIGQIDEVQTQRMLKRKQDLEVRKADVLARQKEMMDKRKLFDMENRENLEKDRELRKLEYDNRKAGILENEKLYNSKKAEILQNQKLYNQKKLGVMKNQQLYNQKKLEVLQNQQLYNQKKLDVLQNQQLYNQKKAEIIQSEKLNRQAKMDDDVSRIITDLANENLVKDENDLSFSLTDKELVVNGKKQPAAIHQTFKEKYIQNSSDRFIYSKKGKSTSITINKE